LRKKRTGKDKRKKITRKDLLRLLRLLRNQLRKKEIGTSNQRQVRRRKIQLTKK
jgi:hypothetical protein